MIRNLEVNQSKIIDLNKKKRLIAQRKARARRRFRTRVGMAAFVVALTGASIAYNSHTRARDDEPVVTTDTVATDDTIYADITDLNNLNIVLVNDGVQDSFINSLSDKLVSILYLLWFKIDFPIIIASGLPSLIPKSSIWCSKNKYW